VYMTFSNNNITGNNSISNNNNTVLYYSTVVDITVKRTTITNMNMLALKTALYNGTQRTALAGTQ